MEEWEWEWESTTLNLDVPVEAAAEVVAAAFVLVGALVETGAALETGLTVVECFEYRVKCQFPPHVVPASPVQVDVHWDASAFWPARAE